MRWSVHRAAALLLLPLLLGATAGAVESFLDGNPKAPEAIPDRRRGAATPPATAAPMVTPSPAR
ncbi:hypothetical protein KF840_18295 [bacterium]|nr:hypothetical protein [bacterium]